jgi:hypothetical protein
VVERVLERRIGSRSAPRHRPPLRRELAPKSTGDIYQRDLPDLTAALTELLAACRRHH